MELQIEGQDLVIIEIFAATYDAIKQLIEKLFDDLKEIIGSFKNSVQILAC